MAITSFITARLTQNYSTFFYYFSDIKSFFGQPDYRSVNLTWEVEDKIADNTIHGSDRNDSKTFVVNYCEIQGWGEMHRCNSRFLIDDDIEHEG